MVYRSAYQRYYRQPRWDDSSVEEFQQKLQYRVDRRSIEHQHQAWLWDSDDEDDDVEEIPMDQHNTRRQDHSRQDENNQTDNERRKSVQAWVKDQQGLKDGERRRDDLKLQDRIREESEKVNEDRIKEANQAEPPRESKKKRHNQRRKRSPKKNKEIPKEKMSVSPKVEALEERRRHPPFLPYGWANDGPTEFKKTHNVLASEHEVYPAALRASKRRQNVIEQKVKLHEEAIRKKELIAPLAEEAPLAFPKDLWMTEYQRNFCKMDDIKRHFGR